MIKRIITQPTKILDKARGAYWRGERCEDIVTKRIATRAAAKAARKSSRGTGPAKEYSPQRQLSRLQRALKKRKTAAGIAAVKARIAALLKSNTVEL